MLDRYNQYNKTYVMFYQETFITPYRTYIIHYFIYDATVSIGANCYGN